MLSAFWSSFFSEERTCIFFPHTNWSRRLPRTLSAFCFPFFFEERPRAPFRALEGTKSPETQTKRPGTRKEKEKRWRKRNGLLHCSLLFLLLFKKIKNRGKNSGKTDVCAPDVICLLAFLFLFFFF